MNNRPKKIAISICCALFLITTAVFSAMYVNARIVFSGMTMIRNGDTTQSFIDISLKNINTPGVSFCLKYNTDYLTLSDAVTNDPILVSSSNNGYNLEHEYFKQNYELFPDECFVNVPPEASEIIGRDLPVLGSADVVNGYMVMNFVPMESAVDESPVINYDDTDGIIIEANSEEGVLIGSLSFRIEDPSALSKLSEEEIDSLIQIVPFSSMNMESGEEDTGVNILYMNEDGLMDWYTRSEKYIDYEIDIEVELCGVTVDNPTAQVTAFDIYRDGTVDDLIYYLNKNMSSVTLEYTNNEKVAGTFVWDKSAEGFSCETWDPKGGTYNISQKYNDDITIQVSVNVVPVTFNGFYADNQYISYVKGAEDFPQTIQDLNFPATATPVLSPNTYNKCLPDVAVQEWYELKGEEGTQLTELPDSFKDGGTVGEYVFIASPDYGAANWSETAPWLTYDTLERIEFTRYIIDSEDDRPKEIEVYNALIDVNGALNVNIGYTDGTFMTDTTEIQIRLPNGEIIDTSAVMTDILIDENDGTALIVISPNINGTDYQKQLAQYFNMGNRIGDYAITARESDKPWGEFKAFIPENRQNVYTESEYVLDYSDEFSGLFHVDFGKLPSDIVTIFGDNRISTTYSGYDGSELGYLQTFKVDGWEVTSGDVDIAGEVITIQGLLSETEYTNYGKVENTQNSVVVLKYINGETAEVDEVEPISDFVFNKQQLGYGYEKLQTQTFTLKNTGITDITGISVNISFDNSGTECFVLSDPANKNLPLGESLTFDITTKHGLPIGDYTATVTISSNRNTLTTFNVSFTVSESPVYQITILTNNSDFGEAKTVTEEYTAQANEVIEITAIPAEDCKFTSWTCEEEDFSVDDPTSATTSFTMPERDIVITANFEETIAAYLRLTQLHVKNSADDSYDEQLYDENWLPVEFSPTVREYYVHVPDTVDMNSLWFEVREEGSDANITVIHQHGSTTSNVDKLFYEEDNLYKTSDFELASSPVENILTIRLSSNDNGAIVIKQYVIHIYRRINQIDLMDSVYGNSPYGLIMKDDAITDKVMAKDLFVNNRYRFVEGYTPANGNSEVRYRSEAWSGVNYDTYDAAIFVVNNEAFVDPGWNSLTNSIGQTVNPEAVSRSIFVNVLAEQDAAYQNGSEEDFTYITPQMIMLDSSSDAEYEVTELKDLRIRPDIYQLKYSFRDFDGTEMVITKPLIILSEPGDLDVNNTKDTKDADNIIHRFETKIPDSSTQEYNVGGKLYKYRVCDTNQDGHVNAVDANVIKANKTVPFYVNMEGGH